MKAVESISQKDLAEIFRNARVEAGFTQRQLADALDISEYSIKNYESPGYTTDGKSTDYILSARTGTMCKIADLFGVSLDYLLGRSKKKHPDEEIRDASEIIGLSESATEKLKHYKSIYNNEYFRRFMILLSDIIASEELFDFMLAMFTARGYTESYCKMLDEYKSDSLYSDFLDHLKLMQKGYNGKPVDAEAEIEFFETRKEEWRRNNTDLSERMQLYTARTAGAKLIEKFSGLDEMTRKEKELRDKEIKMLQDYVRGGGIDG